MSRVERSFYLRVFSLFTRIMRVVEHLFWPKRCSVCEVLTEPESGLLCEDCWQQLSFAVGDHYCHRCGRKVSPYGLMPDGCGYCQGQKIYYDQIYRAGNYDAVLRKLILSFKFQDKTEYAKLLGHMLRDVFHLHGLSETVDCIVPVPLHWKRRQERGFNQSKLLSNYIRFRSVPIRQDLVRIRHTQRQWNLTASQRRTNVKGAFAVRKDHRFEGKKICLVDDITTSGATLNECARTLKDAGAESVFCIVLTVAESSGDS